jgi:hypothetical protein
VQPRLGGTDLDPQQRRRLRPQEPFQVAQDQHGPLVGAQPPQGVDDLQAQVGAVLGGPLGDLLDRDLPGAGPGQLEGLPHRDAPQPALERGRLPKRTQVLEGLDHRLLHGVVTVGERDRAADPPDVGGHGTQQRAHGQRVAPLGRADQLLELHSLKRPGTFRWFPRSPG